MTALGRVAMKYSNGDELALELAKNICKHKLNTQEAINYINRRRKANGEKFGKNRVEGTFKKVVNVINNAGLNEYEINLLFLKIIQIIK